MRHTCVRCGKTFHNPISLDKHATRCRKYWALRGSLGTTSTSRRSGATSGRGRKRTHFETPDQDDQEHPGLSESNEHDNTTPGETSPERLATPPLNQLARSGRNVRSLAS